MKLSIRINFRGNKIILFAYNGDQVHTIGLLGNEVRGGRVSAYDNEGAGCDGCNVGDKARAPSL